MIRTRLYWKIAAGLAVAILLAALGVLVLVTPRVERHAMAQIEQSLLARAQLLRDIARPVLESGGAIEVEQALHDRIDDLGRETRTRLTVIDRDGRVLADSLGKPATMADPHGNRPEIVQARESGQMGTSTRHSRTTGLDLRYLALTVKDAGGEILGYVRTSLPTTWIEERRNVIRESTALGAGLAALFGLLAGLWITRRLTRRLTDMAHAAEAIAEGEHPVLPSGGTDETAELVRALKKMDMQLEERRQALVRERNELAGVLASMHEGVVAVDRRQRVVQINRVARGMLHAGDDDEVVGKHIADVTRVAEVPEIFREVIESGEPLSREVRVVDGPSARVLELHASPLQASGEGLGGAVLVVHDATELRRLEAVRRDFVANVSHELKTPLAAMQGLVETVLDDEEMDEEQRTVFLRRALSQTGRLTALVKDLLSLSRVESETNLLERTRLDMRRPLREAAERLEPVLERSDLELVLDLPDEPLLVVGDEEGIRQIADNLLDNAQKYTPPGGRIRLRAWEEGEDALVEVQDTGIGIQAEHLGRIFERFYRVDKARSRSLGGTGLGLAIVKHLTEAHGGRIEVESVSGEGSTFRVRLPAAA